MFGSSDVLKTSAKLTLAGTERQQMTNDGQISNPNLTLKSQKNLCNSNPKSRDQNPNPNPESEQLIAISKLQISVPNQYS